MFYSRNIGIISEVEQRKICQSSILIAGVGGMGGVAAEMLVRMGVGRIKICDHDIFEETNFNRQLHSNQETIGHKKVEVLKNEFLKINPGLIIEIYPEGVRLDNIDKLLNGIDIVINGMDMMFASLMLERAARKQKKIIVDAWLTPFSSVFVMTPDSPHWEEFMSLPTLNVPLDKITDEMCSDAVKKEVEYTFSHFNPFDIIDPLLVESVTSGKKPRPSMAPVVWLSGALMANEAFKIMTNKPHSDHRGIFYNQYEHALIPGHEVFKSNKKAA